MKPNKPMTAMLKDWWNRVSPPPPIRSGEETASLFVTAIDEARAREDLFRPLFEQLAFALRTGESTIPIDRATIPLHLTMGPGRIKELAAQIKLSPFLRNNIQALVHHFREDQRDLKNAEKAAELLNEQPQWNVRPEATLLVQSLFHFLPASREQFRDYPLFYQLFGHDDVQREDGTVEIPDELTTFLTDLPAIAPTTLAEEGDAEVPQGPDLRSPETVMRMIGVPQLALEVGLDLVPLIDPSLGGELMDRIMPMRLKIATELGFVMPGVQFKDNIALRTNAYTIQVRGNVVAEGELMVGYHLAIENAGSESSGTALVGFPTVDPAFGLPATWVTRAEGKRASKLGFEVLDATDVLVRHMDEVIRAHAYEVLSLEEVSLMLDHLRERAPQSVDAVIPEKLELADYHLILKSLLKERVSIRDQVSILEKLAHCAKPVHPFYLADKFGDNRASVESIMLMEMTAQVRPLADPLILSEMVRQGLSRQICGALADAHGTLDVVMLGAQFEQVIGDAIQTSSTGQILTLAPATRELLGNRLLAECARLDRPIVLCDPRIRPFVKQLTVRTLPRLTVLSHAELHPQYRVQSVGTVLLVES